MPARKWRSAFTMSQIARGLEGAGTGKFGARAACMRGRCAPNLRFPKFRTDSRGSRRHQNLNLLTGPMFLKVDGEWGISIRFVIGLLSRETMGSRQANKFETRFLMRLGIRFQKLSQALPRTHTFSDFAVSLVAANPYFQ